MTTRQDDLVWEPFQAGKTREVRIKATSCCAEYELATQGGEYVILRPNSTGSAGGYEETARGVHRDTIAVWDALVTDHSRQHRRRRDESRNAATYRPHDYDRDGEQPP